MSEPTRQDDEILLAEMREFERMGYIITDSEGEVPLLLTNSLTLAQMAFGSDEAAERAFHRLVTAYDGGAL